MNNPTHNDENGIMLNVQDIIQSALGVTFIYLQYAIEINKFND